MKMGKHWAAPEVGQRRRPNRGAGARGSLGRRCGLAALALLVAASSGLDANLPVRGHLCASASPLDEAGQVSAAVGRLVDGLLDKVGYLAELVIAEAEAEQCEASCGAGPEEPLAERGGAGCRLFGVGVPRSELPAEEMETCCWEHARCYSSCGRPKLACDRQLRACLREQCGRRFEPANATLARYLLDQPPSLEELEPEPEVDEPGEPGEPDERGLRRLRDRHKACRLAGKALIIGNLAFGCHQFKRSQRLACCPAPGAAKSAQAGRT